MKFPNPIFTCELSLVLYPAPQRWEVNALPGVPPRLCHRLLMMLCMLHEPGRELGLPREEICCQEEPVPAWQPTQRRVFPSSSPSALQTALLVDLLSKPQLLGNPASTPSFCSCKHLPKTSHCNLIMLGQAHLKILIFMQAEDCLGGVLRISKHLHIYKGQVLNVCKWKLSA